MSVDLNKSPPKPPSSIYNITQRHLPANLKTDTNKQLCTKSKWKFSRAKRKLLKITKSKTVSIQVAQHLKYDQLYGFRDQPSAGRVEEYQEHQKNSIERYLFVKIALSEDVDNIELKQRTNDYQREIKSFRDKIKEIDKKARKRQT